MYEIPYCKYCGSSEVVADGPCSWNKEKQKWELAGATYDDGGGICQTCGEENDHFDWRTTHPTY